jgi:hypothetical protein
VLRRTAQGSPDAAAGLARDDRRSGYDFILAHFLAQNDAKSAAKGKAMEFTLGIAIHPNLMDTQKSHIIGPYIGKKYQMLRGE